MKITLLLFPFISGDDDVIIYGQYTVNSNFKKQIFFFKLYGSHRPAICLAVMTSQWRIIPSFFLPIQKFGNIPKKNFGNYYGTDLKNFRAFSR
jgi:hypothetical protein